MGLLDFLSGNGNTDPSSSSLGTDPTASLMGSLINLNPTQVSQLAAMRQQQGLLGMTAGMGAATAPSRLPIPLSVVLGGGAGGALSAEQGVPTQLLASAQAGNASAEGLLNRINAQTAAIKFPLWQAEVN